MPLASEVKQRILDYLRAAETPKKAMEVASGCSITKREANNALYTLHKEGQVQKQEGGKWVVCADGTELESCCKTPQPAAGKCFGNLLMLYLQPSDTESN